MGKRAQYKPSGVTSPNHSDDDHDGADNSDAASNASLDSEAIGNSTDLLTESSLSEQLENLLEERPTARTYALDILYRGLSTHRPQWTFDNKASLSSNLKRCATRGGKEESHMAFKVMEVVSVTLGGDSEEALSEWADTLYRTASNPEETFRKDDALTLYALLCWLADSSGDDTERCLSLCESILEGKQPESSSVMVTAAHVWALLITTLPLKEVALVQYEKGVALFSELLVTESVDVRVASGENIALLVDLFAADPEQTKPRHPYTINEDLPSLIEELLSECSKTRSKKDKLKQRSAFRSISDTLDNGDTPTERIVMHSRALDFKSWRQLCRLDFLRSVLASGFQHHFFDNEVIGEILDVDIPKSTHNMSKEEKRSQHNAASAASKVRNNARNKQRHNKTNHVIGEAGDE